VSGLPELEARAEEKRRRLDRTLDRLEERATLSGLADDILARSGGLPQPREIMEALRRNPFVAIGLAVCAGLLVIEINRARRGRILNGRSNAARTPLSTLDENKESHHARRTEHQ